MRSELSSSVLCDVLRLLKFNVMLRGLVEDSNMQVSGRWKETAESTCQLDEISYVSEIKRNFSLNVECLYKDPGNSVLYGLVNYELTRGLFYHQVKWNKEVLKVIYKYSNNDEASESVTSTGYVKYFGLSKDKGEILELSTLTKELIVRV